jgi:hypothetical protein
MDGELWLHGPRDPACCNHHLDLIEEPRMMRRTKPRISIFSDEQVQQPVRGLLRSTSIQLHRDQGQLGTLARYASGIK